MQEKCIINKFHSKLILNVNEKALKNVSQLEIILYLF